MGWLVVDLPLWKIWKSIGMMNFPIYGKIKVMFQSPPTVGLSIQVLHQPTNPQTLGSKFATSDECSHRERNLQWWNKTPPSVRWPENLWPASWRSDVLHQIIIIHVRSELNQAAWATPKRQIDHKYVFPLKVHVPRRNLAWATPEKIWKNKISCDASWSLVSRNLLEFFFLAKGRVAIATKASTTPCPPWLRWVSNAVN